MRSTKIANFVKFFYITRIQNLQFYIFKLVDKYLVFTDTEGSVDLAWFFSFSVDIGFNNLVPVRFDYGAFV